MAWRDLIDGFLELSDGIPSPPIFRLWAAIGLVAGALERRIWVETVGKRLYPNLFTVLVAPPAVGKSQALDPVSELWYGAKKFHVAPDNMTKASLVDAIGEAKTNRMVAGALVEYHSLLVCASEFGVLVPAHDLEFMSVLNKIFDNPKFYRENRRSLSKQVDITHPQLNILAGTQPGFLASLLPEEAWTMGFTSRLIMIYSAQTPDIDLFAVRQQAGNEAEMVKQLERLGDLYGCCLWQEDAKVFVQDWVKAKMPPAPTRSKLVNYCGRRLIHWLKLSMIAALSRTAELIICLEDVKRAQRWLLDAEQTMPDVFRDMVGKSDFQVIQELHFFLWSVHVREKQKPIHESKLIHFLSTRMPTDKIPRLIEMAEKANVIARHAGTNTYSPRPVHEHGME